MCTILSVDCCYPLQSVFVWEWSSKFAPYFLPVFMSDFGELLKCLLLGLVLPQVSTFRCYYLKGCLPPATKFLWKFPQVEIIFTGHPSVPAPILFEKLVNKPVRWARCFHPDLRSGCNGYRLTAPCVVGPGKPGSGPVESSGSLP